MGRFKYCCLLAVVLMIFLMCGCGDESAEDTADISVSSSYLSCAVSDIAGSRLDVFSLVPPGMCPGHFDISPSQVGRVCTSRVLFIFDFQESMKDSLSKVTNDDVHIETIAPGGGLCIPDTYAKVCRKVCDVLSKTYPENSEWFRESFNRLEARLDDLGSKVKSRIEAAGLDGKKVICSIHQAGFAEWLGLEVVGTFKGRDTETAGGLNECIKAGLEQDAGVVIANKQEGTKLTEVIADRLGAEMVVFSNFPETKSDNSGFVELINQNVDKLAEIQ
jgi:ABC-type Zn uptake system ZnuABC Zn-binding protein ZnuA